MSVRRRGFLLLTGMLSATLVVAAACGGSDSKNKTPAAGSPAPNETALAAGDAYSYVLTQAPADAAPADQQKLTVNLRGEPKSIDPGKSNFADNIAVEHLIFSGLLTFDDNVKVVPLVANEVPSRENAGIAADGLTYTFHLRNDVKWSDGKTLTAKDFEFAIKRLFDPAIGVYYASYYTTIVGAQETYSATDASPADIAALTAKIGVTAIDDLTLEIKLKQALPTFLERMALHAVLPVREDVVTAHPEDWTEPATIVTNGPYTLQEWAHGDHITLAANSAFFLGAPVLKQITMQMQTDTNVSLGDYDAKSGVLDTTAVPPAAVRSARESRKAELREGSQLTTFALQPNNTKAPFDDANFRKAVAAAMDRDAFVQGVLQGVGLAAITWVPPGIPGYDKTIGIPFDKEAAKKYLAASKYADASSRPAITFTIADDTQNQLIGEYVKAQMKDVLGIDVKIDVMESAAFEDAYTKSDFQLAYGGWGADYPDPDNWFPELFGTGKSSNQYKYSSSAVDALFKQAAAETDNAKRIDEYVSAGKIVLVDDAGVVPMYHSATFHLVKPRVKNWRQHPLDARIPGDYSYARVYIGK